MECKNVCRAHRSNPPPPAAAAAGPVALELYQALTGLQQEKSEDPFGWVAPVEA